MLDYLPILKFLSEAFQREDLLVVDIPALLETCVLRLMDLKFNPGMNMVAFSDNFEPHLKSYEHYQNSDNCSNKSKITINVSGPTNPIDWTKDTLSDQLISATIDYIDKRFGNFSEPPLCSFKALDIRQLQLNRQELAVYGRSDLQNILDFFPTMFPKGDHPTILHQFLELKVHLKGLKSQNNGQVYMDMIQQKPPRFSSVLSVVELMLTISGSTAKCERAFSQMNQIKTCLRTRLNQETLNALMRIRLEGPEFKDFQPEESVNLWLRNSKGSRHVNGHSRWNACE